MLTLGQTTLFYWMLRDSALNTKRPRYNVKGWADTVPGKVSWPSNQAAGSHITTTSSNPPPSLAGGSSCLTAPFVLTNDINITSRPCSSLALANVKVKLANAIDVLSNGGLSDNDEIKGAEWEVVVNYPPKGKKHIMSNVSPYYVFFCTPLRLTSFK